MYKNSFYLTIKLTALAAVTAYHIPADAQGGMDMVCALTFCCLFLTDFLLGRLCPVKKIRLLFLFIEIMGCLLCGAGFYFPVLLMLLYQLIDLSGTEGYFYHISVAAAFLAAFIFEPPFYSGVTAFILTIMGAFARYHAKKLGYYKRLSEELRENISRQNEKIAGFKAYAKTLRESVSLEERSRFSARIHDRLGHGISGSIILLEGVKLNLESNPAQAEKNLCVAIENLRGSVDSIREALREERPALSAAGITDLREMLEHFSLTYGIKTDFSCDGDTEKIPPQIWNCLRENLTEAMTNTVKHTNASMFEFRIYIYNKIIRASFADNGGAVSFQKGMGLEAMEERTVICGGTCIYECDVRGFKIINIFRL